MGGRSFGTLVLSVLPRIDKDVWHTDVAADAILVWGGDPLFIAQWIRTACLGDALGANTVYVGTSAGSMAATTMIGETYTNPRRARGVQARSRHRQ